MGALCLTKKSLVFIIKHELLSLYIVPVLPEEELVLILVIKIHKYRN